MLFRRKPPPPDASRSPLILIIDDEPDLCELLRLALQPHGYAVAVAYDGLAGLDRAAALRPALIILDIQMPRMNGYQVLARMQQDPALAATPVIVITSLTGEGEMTDEEWTRRLSVKRLISKPFGPEVVVAAVREVVPPAPGQAS